jgi:ABC-2 type transport system ATP-binding protein
MQVKALKIQNLAKVYDGNIHALKGINLEVEQGDFFALLGPNGAGKSTTISIISSLVKKTEGTVSIFGHDLDKALEHAKLKIGLVPQEFNFNVFEPLTQILINQAGYFGVPYRVAKQRSEKYLRLLDLWDKRNVRARELSGGMKRRLMIARALMHEPKLLILDEPTAGVDIELRRTMWDFLRQINAEGTTIILTTHYLEEAEMLCRHIGIIDQGQLVACTTMKEILQQVDMETFILDLKQPFLSDTILESNIRQIDQKTIEVDIQKQESLNATFTLLTQGGYEVLSMRNKANRLEELFMQLVEKNSLGRIK